MWVVGLWAVNSLLDSIVIIIELFIWCSFVKACNEMSYLLPDFKTDKFSEFVSLNSNRETSRIILP